MLGIDGKAARYTWTAAVVLLGLFLVYVVRSTLFVFILAVLFAYLLSPLVNLLDRFLPTRTRTPALALAYVIFIGVVVFVGIQVGSTVANQAKQFEKDLPAKIGQFEKPNPKLPESINNLKAQLVDRIRKQLSKSAQEISPTVEI